MANIIEILIGATDNASPKLNAAEKAAVKSADAIKKMGIALVGIGTAAVAGLGIATKNALDFADNVKQMSGQTGLAAEQVQRLAYAASQNETPMEAVVVSLTKLAIAATKAKEGGKEQTQAFNRLGIAATDANGNVRDSLDIMLDLADRFSAGKISSEDLANGLELIGARGGRALIPMLRLGSAGIKDFMDKAAVLDGTKVEALDKLGDDFADLRLRVGMLTAEIVSGLVPVMEQMIEAGRKLLAWFQSLSPQTRQAIGQVAMLGVGVLSAAGALMVLGGAFRTIAILGSPLVLQLLAVVVALDLAYRVGSALAVLLGKLIEGFGRLTGMKGAQLLGMGVQKEGQKGIEAGMVGTMAQAAGISGVDLGGLVKSMFVPAASEARTGSRTQVNIRGEFTKSDDALDMLRGAVETAV